MSKTEPICGIYKITSPTGRIYIGQSVNCLIRKKDYSKGRCNGQPRLSRSIKKHGWDNHKFEVIHVCNVNASPDELNKLEKHFILLYDSFDTPHGLNLTDGGSNGRLSQETKIKQSLAAKGKPKSEQHKENVRKANIGKKASLETRQKMSKAHTGKIVSDQMRQKCRETKLGDKNPMFGKKTSDEVKEKLRVANLRNGTRPPVMKGKDNPRYGKPLSAELKHKLLMANLGKKQSPETILKKSESLKKAWAKRKQQLKLNNE